MRLPSRTRAWMVAGAASILLAVISVALSAQSAPSSSTGTSHESFDDLYRRGHQTGATIKTLTATFTETSTSSLLARPLVARGTIAVQRPARVAMRFTDPEQRVVVIDGDRMTTSWPARKLREFSNIKSAQGRVQKYFEADTSGELRRQFDVTLRDTSERPGTYEVTLIPKRRQVRDTMTRLDLWVGTSSFLLDAIRLTFANGDTKTIVFDNVVLNPSLEANAFAVDPP